MRTTRSIRSLVACAGLTMMFWPVGQASGGNVDISTLLRRGTVQLTIYNSEDITLVRETRRLTFRKGINPLQFSWANTLIDPTSVDLRFKTEAARLDVLDTTYPHDRPQVLYWNVQSAFDGEAVVEITYFTSGITWAADYACVSDAGEEAMSFEGFVRITNNSGEDYADANVRLVVGEINLVEKVADLARRGAISADDAAAYFARSKRVAEFDESARISLGAELHDRFDSDIQQEKEIIKEGLSEYFIYTIEGTETIPHSWSKRMRLFQGLRVPFQVKYRYRPAEYGDQLVRLFILRNDEKSKLGSTPLPDGVVRLFRDNQRDGLSFVTAYQTKYVPVGAEIELNLGRDPEVVHERLRLETRRDDFWFRDTRGKKYFSQAQERQVRHDYPVAGWNDHERWVERIRNYRDKSIDVEIRLAFDGHVIFTSGLDPVLHDYRSPQFSAEIEPGREDLSYLVTLRNGINAKQQNVTLESGD